jgi:BTB/POZ domain
MDSPISHPPLKRPRTESQPKPNRSVPWFDDGNIILEAELSQFRVYRGILSAHSVIFKDMFDLAQPSEGENMGSCPVVHLSDRAQDVRIILEVLHNSIHRYYNSDSLKGTILLRH